MSNIQSSLISENPFSNYQRQKKYDVYGVGNALIDMEFEVLRDSFPLLDLDHF